MIYAPIGCLKSGMIVARSLRVGESKIPLMLSGQELTDKVIGKLNARNIPGVYIFAGFADELALEEIYTPEMQQKMTASIKSCFKDYLSTASLSLNSIKNINSVVDNIVQSLLDTPECIFNILKVEDYDNYTFTHSINVATLAVIIGMKQNLSKNCLRDLAMAGILHDVGKLEVPVEIINKPSRLSDEEMSVIRTHADIAYNRLDGSPKIPSQVVMAIREHHERYDGTGYSRGLKGKDISMYARILAIADVYDALTSQRPYRKAWMPNEAMEYMMGNSGSHFDPDLLDGFMKTIAPYPIGTMVVLSNGAVGLVIKNFSDFPTRPTVKIIFPKDERNKIVDLSSDYTYLSTTVLRVASSDDIELNELLKS